MRLRALNLRSACLAGATVVVIAAAAALWHVLPTNTQIYAPFDVHGGTGDTVTGRAIAATVHGARVAPEVRTGASGQRIAAAGQWVVVDVTARATRESVTLRARLVVAGNTYEPSARFKLKSLGAGWVDPGIPQRGVWAFDVAAELLDSEAAVPFVLQVGVGADDRLDSRLVIACDKDDVSHQDVVTLKPLQVGE